MLSTFENRNRILEFGLRVDCSFVFSSQSGRTEEYILVICYLFEFIFTSSVGAIRMHAEHRKRWQIDGISELCHICVEMCSFCLAHGRRNSELPTTTTPTTKNAISFECLRSRGEKKIMTFFIRRPFLVCHLAIVAVAVLCSRTENSMQQLWNSGGCRRRDIHGRKWRSNSAWVDFFFFFFFTFISFFVFNLLDLEYFLQFGLYADAAATAPADLLRCSYARKRRKSLLFFIVYMNGWLRELQRWEHKRCTCSENEWNG